MEFRRMIWKISSFVFLQFVSLMTFMIYHLIVLLEHAHIVIEMLKHKLKAHLLEVQKSGKELQ